MVYREPAGELARRQAREAETGPLLRLDVSGRRGADGVDGAPGRHGSTSGSDGGRGGDAGPASPGERGGRIVVELAQGTRDAVAVVRGEASSLAQNFGQVGEEVSFARAGSIELLARGGNGGRGGIGGHGGGGATGSTGSDATRYSSGSNGGPGGDGGDGGNGTSGANGGRGGDVLVRVDDRDTHLLMLVAHDVGGGAGGHEGANGDGGSGGSGGRGGSSYSWTETESYTDSNGQSQTRTTFHSNSGGSSGPSGRSGRPGGARITRGANGEHGSFSIEVKDARGKVLTRASSRYDVALVSFRHRNANDDGVYEPEEQVFVSHVEVMNTGGMPLPAHHDVVVRLHDDGWIAPAEGGKFTLPRALAPGERHVFTEHEVGLTLRVFRPQVPGAALAAPETIRLFCELPDVRRQFPAFWSATNEEQGRIVIRFPVEVSPITSLYSLAPGQAARVRWSIANVAEKAFGLDSDLGRAVGVRLRLEGGELCEDDLMFVDPSGARRPIGIGNGYEVDVARIEAKGVIAFEGSLAIAPHAPPYTSARLVVSAELGHIASPTTMRSIQLQEITIRVGQPFAAEGADQDVLLVTNNRTTADEVARWQELVKSLGLSVSVWDAALEGGMGVLREIAAGKANHRLVVLLNNTMDTAAGERRASLLVDKSTVHALARRGTHVLYIGRAPGFDTLGIPTTTAPCTAARRWYVFPWSVPRESTLEAHAEKVGAALARAFPERRWVVVHRFDPVVERKRLFARHVRLGEVEVRRTLHAARGALTELEVDAAEMHGPALPSADHTFAVTVQALPFVAKAKLFEHTSTKFGDRSAKLDDGCADVFVSAVLWDLLREQRAAAQHPWRHEDLARALPMLTSFTKKAFEEPIELSSDAARRVVELVAWLDVVARDHDRWYEWIPPFAFLRRGPQLRRVVRAALADLVKRAFGGDANVEAAWKVIAERRREIVAKKKLSYERAAAFTHDRLSAAIAARKVTSDAERVAPVKVMSGGEFDELAKSDAARAGRAEAVLASSAAARAALSVPEGWTGLAARAGVVATRIAAEAAPVSREIADEDAATAEDLAGLRELT